MAIIENELILGRSVKNIKSWKIRNMFSLFFFCVDGTPTDQNFFRHLNEVFQPRRSLNLVNTG